MRLMKHLRLIFQIFLIWYLTVGNEAAKMTLCGCSTPVLAWWCSQMVANIHVIVIDHLHLSESLGSLDLRNRVTGHKITERLRLALWRCLVQPPLLRLD